jgi:hypothetical protein
MQEAIYLAKKMGENMGRSKILQQQVPKKINNHEHSNIISKRY